MFLKEALLRCAQLQQEAASCFDALCEGVSAGDSRVAAWRGASLRERRRAALLEALAGLYSALEDEGPFVVQIPLQLEEVRRALDSIAWRRDTCPDHPRCACGEMLARIPGGRLYGDLVELAEPEVRRVLRLVTNEVRALHNGNGAASRRNGRIGAMCTT